MKLQILSDLHLELASWRPPETDADVVVLAGDIGVGRRGIEWAASAFGSRPVIYVAGNHEYYGHAIPALTEELRRAAAGTRVHFLEEEQLILSGVRFLGCTLWTDFALFGRGRERRARPWRPRASA